MIFRNLNDMKEQPHELRRRNTKKVAQSLCCRKKLWVASEQKVGRCGLGRMRGQDHGIRFCRSGDRSAQARFLGQEEEF